MQKQNWMRVWLFTKSVSGLAIEWCVVEVRVTHPKPFAKGNPPNRMKTNATRTLQTYMQNSHQQQILHLELIQKTLKHTHIIKFSTRYVRYISATQYTFLSHLYTNTITIISYLALLNDFLDSLRHHVWMILKAERKINQSYKYTRQDILIYTTGQTFETIKIV